MKLAELEVDKEYLVRMPAGVVGATRRARLHFVFPDGLEFHSLHEETGDTILTADGRPLHFRLTRGQLGRVEQPWAHHAQSEAVDARRSEVANLIRVILAAGGLRTTLPAPNRPSWRKQEPDVWVQVDSSDGVTVTGLGVIAYEPQSIEALLAILQRAAGLEGGT